MMNQPPPDFAPRRGGTGLCDTCNDAGTRSLSQGIHQLIAVNFVNDPVTGDLTLTTPQFLIAFNEGQDDTANGQTGYGGFQHNAFTTNAFSKGFLSIDTPFALEAIGFSVENVLCPAAGVTAGGVISGNLNFNVPAWLEAYRAKVVKAMNGAFGFTATFNTGEKCEFQLGALPMFPGGNGVPFSGEENGTSLGANVQYLKRKLLTPPLVVNGVANFQLKLERLNTAVVRRDPNIVPAPDADVSVFLRATCYGERISREQWREWGGNPDAQNMSSGKG